MLSIIMVNSVDQWCRAYCNLNVDDLSDLSDTSEEQDIQLAIQRSVEESHNKTWLVL